MRDVRVVSRATLVLFFNRLPYFHSNTVIDDVASTIELYALRSRLIDLLDLINPAFCAWKSATHFFPRNSMAANVRSTSHVREYLHYAGNEYYRDRHLAGIRFAAFVVSSTNCVVIWTYAHKAYVFEDDETKSEEWTLKRILHRQDDVFATWMRYLRKSSLSDVRTFRREVFPFFARSTTEYSIPENSSVWQLVKRVSYMTVAENDDERMTWKPYVDGV